MNGALQELCRAFVLLFKKKPASAGSHFGTPSMGALPGCKSSRKLTTASEVKRNCMRATECGKEAWNVNHEPMDKNQIEGVCLLYTSDAADE